MTAHRRSWVRPGVLLLAFLSTTASAQYGSTTSSTQPNNYPPALPARRGPGLSLVFERLGEITLPGPLAPRSAWLADDLVLVPLADGLVRVAPESGATPVAVPADGRPEASEWVASPNGKRRYRTTPEGLVEAEHRRRARARWARSWRIVSPNSIVAPPILFGPRLCYAGLDDRVTCVRASNGHRLWTVDLGDRLSHALSLWPAQADRPADGEFLLVVPDDGASVIALDAYDGRRVATYALPPNHRFASPALVASRDQIAIARKGYDEREAAVVLLRLKAPPVAVPPGPVPYNEASPAQTGPSGR